MNKETRIPNGSTLSYEVEINQSTLKLYSFGYEFGAELKENDLYYHRAFIPNAYRDSEECYSEALTMFDKTLAEMERRHNIKIDLGKPNFEVTF